MKFKKNIQKLMVTVVDKESEDFVKRLALDELRRLNVNIDSFIQSNIKSNDEDLDKQPTEKQLLQEEK